VTTRFGRIPREEEPPANRSSRAAVLPSQAPRHDNPKAPPSLILVIFASMVLLRQPYRRPTWSMVGLISSAACPLSQARRVASSRPCRSAPVDREGGGRRPRSADVRPPSLSLCGGKGRGWRSPLLTVDCAGEWPLRARHRRFGLPPTTRPYVLSGKTPQVRCKKNPNHRATATALALDRTKLKGCIRLVMVCLLLLVVWFFRTANVRYTYEQIGGQLLPIRRKSKRCSSCN
jgi:hypothetical protein